MATIRVFVPTFRRATLLPRALASLQAQTFSDWTCEVHNDDPRDHAPQAIVDQLNDHRIRLITHDRQLGATAAFNLFFKAAPEPFYTMLEDDNWWEPEFLATMLEAARVYPRATLIWANMRLWQEMRDGSFRFTGKTVWPRTEAKHLTFEWANPAQMCGALHSNGAALIRSRPGDNFSIPNVPFAAVEPFRERALPHPLVLITKPLANFSITQKSARNEDYAAWGEAQTALAATFLKYTPMNAAERERLWSEARRKAPPGTGVLINAALMEPACRQHLRHSRARDWIRWLIGIVRRPNAGWQIMRSRQRHPDWWSFLERHTMARQQAAKGSD